LSSYARLQLSPRKSLTKAQISNPICKEEAAALAVFTLLSGTLCQLRDMSLGTGEMETEVEP
jgi:hypothetical protein